MIEEPFLFVLSVDYSWFFVGAKNEWLFFYSLLLKWIVILGALSFSFELCEACFFKVRFLF